ncbi:hypothetical protein B0J14DRAFT_643016 [Halenospora varia]|nr:hypothetical protein B0J14DRAFT_643016 [Halenospora varia]
MKIQSLLLLAGATTGVLAQLSAIPSCAQECFARALSLSYCLTQTSAMDPACACTSLSISSSSSGSGRTTAISYATYCASYSTCTSKELTLLTEALLDICYDSNNKPKYACGGGAVSSSSLQPTGSSTITLGTGSLERTLTVPLYPKYITTLHTTTNYGSTTYTRTYYSSSSTITSIIPTRVLIGYQVCPTSIILPTSATVSLSTYRTTLTSVKAVTPTPSQGLWDKITSQATATGSSQDQGSSTTSGTGTGASFTILGTSTFSGSSTGSGSGTPTGTGAVSVSSSGSQATGAAVAGKVGVIGAAAIGVLAALV